MSTISATAVKELREMSGAGMMDCKKALTEASGNLEDAIEIHKDLYKTQMWLVGTLSDRRYLVAKDEEILKKLMSDFPDLNFSLSPLKYSHLKF